MPRSMGFGDFAAVLAAAKVGADWAWRELYAGVAGQLIGYATAKGVVDAEDVGADVMERVAENIGGFHGDEPAFRSWVFTIAHHRIVDQLRRQRPTAPIESVAGVLTGREDPEATVLADLGAVRALALLDELPPDHRDVVLLRVIAGFDVGEVAGILGRRPGTVRVQQHRAFRRLRGHVAQSTRSDVTR
ncbi:MAG: sigma-70 family RNA polymerase sigma factor [Actinomycetota bacterium]